MLARYVKAGGRSLAPPRRPARSHGKAASNWFGSNEVHDWAKANGIEVKDRGRVPADVVTRFRAATGR